MRSTCVAVLVAALALGCDGTPPVVSDAGRARPLVVALDHPLAWCARRLAGESAEVLMPVPVGSDPLHWIPDDDAIALMQGADLVLLDGTGVQGWLATAPLPGSRVVDVTAAVADRLLPSRAGPEHRHGLLGEHSHGALAGTTWLDPTLFAERLAAEAEALTRLQPERRAAIESGRRAIAERLEALDTRLAAAVARDPMRPLLASHPVYDYLAARYGLALRSLHWEPDALPDDAQWAALEALLAEHPARSMLWEAQPLPAVSARLAGLGVTCEEVAPCGGATPDDADLLARFDANAAALERAFTR